jgi:FG-GAP-like repeat
LRISSGRRYKKPVLWLAGSFCLQFSIYRYITENKDSGNCCADVNGDGYIDVCVLLFSGNSGTYAGDSANLYCWLNKKNGTFGSATFTGVQVNVANIPFGSTSDLFAHTPLNIAPAGFVDINSDSHQDYCLRLRTGMDCWINTGSTSGGVSFSHASVPGLTNAFPSTGTATNWDSPEYSSTLQFVDFNADGRPDICGRASTGMTCLINTPSSANQVWNFTPLNSNFINQYPDSSGYNAASLYNTFRFYGMSNGTSSFFTRTTSGPAQISYISSTSDVQTAVDLLAGISSGSAPTVNIFGSLWIPGTQATNN